MEEAEKVKKEKESHRLIVTDAKLSGNRLVLLLYLPFKISVTEISAAAVMQQK